MRALAVIFVFISLHGMSQGIDDSQLSPEPAFGGISDYDPLLFMSFFEADEVEAIIADPKNEEQLATEELSSPQPKAQPIAAEVKPSAETSNPSYEACENSTNFVRGYIQLDQKLRFSHASYDLYGENGWLIESGRVRYKKSIRVPWSAEGTVQLILHSISGSTSYLFNASP